MEVEIDTATLIIPAHDEESTIGRLLSAVLRDARPDEFEIVVVCNGCSDATADVARAFGPAVTVLEIDQPSKQEALRRGNAQARNACRVYVDADVEIGTDGVRALLSALADGSIMAAGPTRQIPRDAVSPVVRAYFDVWERLPQVRSGLFGRGVIAISGPGYDRIKDLPPVLSDDLAMSEAFAPEQRRIVAEAVVVVRPPRTVAALINRRVRVHTGVAQLAQLTTRPTDSATGIGDLLRIVRDRPALIGKVPVFVGVAVMARSRARKHIRSGDFTTWLRDESSRVGDDG